MSATVGLAWSDNTLKSRNSQWKKYFEFCISMGLAALPADVSTTARFLVYLSRTCKFSTINNYLSAVNVLHKYHGHDIDFRKFYLIQLIVRGLKRQLGTNVVQSRPFSKDELLCMYNNMDHSSSPDLVMWTAVTFLFRTLLRKSNYIPDTLCANSFLSHMLICDVREKKKIFSRRSHINICERKEFAQILSNRIPSYRPSDLNPT